MQNRDYNIIVIGAGHAGCEAALAAARMGAQTLLVTMNLFTVAQMSCNPAIGGLAKGHLVKEIDALGGQMGFTADESGIQFRMLNKSKGPSVWSPRSQNDRMLHSYKMKATLENQNNLHLRQHDVLGLLVQDGKVCGIKSDIGGKIYADAVVICSGTFLNGLIHVGLAHFPGGRSGEMASQGLSDFLRQKGVVVGRLKTGTPPRIDGRTADFTAMIRQEGDPDPQPFSHRHDSIDVQQMPCFITKTTPKTHDILKTGLDRSPLYTGIIKGVGPRYCPSIEDKIFRFGDKDSHQLFMEPEGRNTQEYYLNGFSSSLPEDVQVAAVHSIPGLEKAKITRLAYAIEYDYFPPSQLTPALESKVVENLFFAGQINGTSGYEEAAAQGLIAGINAVLKIRGEAPLVLDRAQAYMGVLVDDLVTKEVDEPYRMFTSLAEHRLLLRQDNADLRLMDIGHSLGLVSRELHVDMLARKTEIGKAIEMLANIKVAPEAFNPLLQRLGSSSIAFSESIAKLIKRPELSLVDFSAFSSHALFSPTADRFWQKVRVQVEIELKYEGFLQRQKQQVQRLQDLEDAPIPAQFDYALLPSVSKESREKLQRIRPRTLGQASRILGVSASDVSILMMYLRKPRASQHVPRETSPGGE